MTKLFLRSLEIFWYDITLSLIIYEATQILFRAEVIDFIGWLLAIKYYH